MNYVENDPLQLENNVVNEDLVFIKKEDSDLKKNINQNEIFLKRLEKEKTDQIFMLQTEIVKLKHIIRKFFLTSGKFSI